MWQTPLNLPRYKQIRHSSMDSIQYMLYLLIFFQFPASSTNCAELLAAEAILLLVPPLDNIKPISGAYKLHRSPDAFFFSSPQNKHYYILSQLCFSKEDTEIELHKLFFFSFFLLQLFCIIMNCTVALTMITYFCLC